MESADEYGAKKSTDMTSQKFRAGTMNAKEHDYSLELSAPHECH